MNGTNTCRLPSWFVLTIFILTGCYVQLASAQNINLQDSKNTVPVDSLGLKWKTLGGKQFWTDVHHCGGWRIQKNAMANYCRLLDKSNVQHVCGTLDACHNELDQLIAKGDVQQVSGRVVIVLHGLIRTSNSMRLLGQHLAKNSELTAVNFEYASTRRPTAEHAKALAQVVDSLGDQVTEINFVGHSLGNIVVRHYIADQLAAGKLDARFKRMVMIGPPNQGSKMARVLRKSFLFKVIGGSSGAELGYRWDELEPRLATPPFEFGIIAGGQSENQKLSNFVLSGKDDFTVSVEETKLSGAADFMVRPLVHSNMMRKKVTLDATLSFFEHGYFVSADSRNPIE